MREIPFSIMLDASNDEGLEEMLPITVRIFYINISRVMTKLFDINLHTGRDASTAKAMFDRVNAQLEK